MTMPSSATERTKILLCDDARDIIALLEAEIDLHPDLEVVAEATTGREAVDLAERHQPDVVVLDLTMPDMDGLQALPEIRKVAPSARIVVLSAFEAGGMAAQVVQLGARRYIEKGAAAPEIACAVREVAEAG